MLRIGELARRTGVSTDLLRAWERRYGLLEPVRSEGGYRLYAVEDVARVGRMRDLLTRGYAAAEAAVLARLDAPERPGGDAPEAPGSGPSDLVSALLALDEQTAQRILDRELAAKTPEAVVAATMLPALREIGARWQRGDASIAQEHFASNLLRGRLLGLARGWDQGAGPRALLACPPGELHDLALIAFGVALSRRGWRILFLGADTPLETVSAAAASERPDIVVLASSRERTDLDLRELASVAKLVLAGRWPELDVDATRVEGDPVGAAAVLAG